MFEILREKREEILEKWIRSIDLEIDEEEIRYQFSKLLDSILDENRRDFEENIKTFADEMGRYDIPPKDISKMLIRLFDIIVSMNILTPEEMLELNKVVYSLALDVYEEFERRNIEIIKAQIETIKKMELPILRIDSATLLIPIVGFIDSQKAYNLMRKVLHEIREKKALNVIIDIEGIPVIDTEVAHQFLKIYRGIKIVGAKLVMSGITPEVAETLVRLDIDLPIPTRANLEMAIEAVRNKEI